MKVKQKLFVLLIMSLPFLGCKEKKESIEVTDSNLAEVLSTYGKENPENKVTLETPYGVIKLKLYDETPLHRANFIKLIKDGYYENAQFYRIVYQFMIQAGTYPKELSYTLPAEFNKKYIHKRGALSMARSEEDNPEKRSSASEFFIVHGSPYKDY